MIKGYRAFQSRLVRIFISSTFQDMDAERKLLVDDVFPRLRARFAPRGVVITEVDLRWGIPERIVSDHRALQICIEEIMNCKPFFMGILGKREGYHPADDEIELLDERLRGLIDLDGSHGLSITDMEIHAGLNLSTPSTASFHLRGEDVEGSERLNAFERRMNSLGYPCMRYASLNDFSDQVVSSLSAMIEAHFSRDDLDELDKMDATYRAHLSRLVAESMDVVPNEQLRSLLAAVREGTSLHIRAGRGRGKTAALSYLAVMLGDVEDQRLFFHFVSADSGASTGELWRRLLLFLGDDGVRSEADAGDVGLWLRAHPLTEPTYVLVDDAARFRGHQDVRARLLSLSEMDPNLTVVCTGDDVPFSWRGQLVELLPLDDDQLRCIAAEYFGRYGKVLDEEYADRLCQNEALRNPLLLRCLLDEQRTALSFEGFDQGFERLSSIASFDEAIDAICLRVSGELELLGLDRLVPWRVGAALACVKGGLREEELLFASSALPLEWSIVHAALQGMLREFDGLWMLSNELVREALIAAVHKNQQGLLDRVRLRLIAHFRSDVPCARTCDELAHLLVEAKDEDGLLELLGSFPSVAPLLRGGRESLVGYLTKVQGRSRELAEPLAESMGADALDTKTLDGLLLSLNESGCYQAVEEMAQLLRASFEGSVESLAIVAKHEARSQYKMGAAHYQRARSLYDEAIGYLEDRPDRRSQASLAELIFKQSIVYKSMGLPARARMGYERAIEIYQRLGIEDVNASWARGNLASLAYLYGDDELAARLFDEAIGMRARAYGERSSEVAWTYNYAFSLAFSTGRLEQADALSAAALSFYAESFGTEGPQYAWSEVNRANYLVATGQLDAARDMMWDSIEKNERFRGVVRTTKSKKLNVSTYSLTSVGNLAVVDWLMGRHAEAQEMFSEVAEHTRRIHGESHPYTCDALLNVALAGNKSEAVYALPPLLAALEAELGEQAPDVRFVRRALELASGGTPLPKDVAGPIYLARNNGAQLIVVPDWMHA